MRGALYPEQFGDFRPDLEATGADTGSDRRIRPFDHLGRPLEHVCSQPSPATVEEGPTPRAGYRHRRAIGDRYGQDGIIHGKQPIGLGPGLGRWDESIRIVGRGNRADRATVDLVDHPYLGRSEPEPFGQPLA